MKQKYYYFGEFCVDTCNATLTCCAEQVPLTPKAFSLLVYLIQQAGQLASKEKIFEQVWTDRVVTDAALTVCIRELRAALDDNARDPRFIETISKRGYRFIASVQKSGNDFSSQHHQQIAVPASVPLVGREAAQAELARCKELAETGTRQLVFVTGEPGIGKTTLIESFVTQYSDDKDIWLARGQCIEHYGVSEAYMPVMDSVGNLSRRRGGRLTSILKKYAPTMLAQFPALYSEHTQNPQSLNIQPERMLREITDALEVMAEDQLLVLILEDLHWSDLSTIELLEFLGRRGNDAKLLIIGSFRPTDAAMNNHPVKKICDDLQRRCRCINIALGCLSDQQVNSYIQLNYPGHEFPANFSTKVREKTDGNPLFMVNLLDYLLRSEPLQPLSVAENRRVDFQEIDACIFDDIQGVISQQVEQLSTHHQRILEAASTICEPTGLASEFTLEEVAAVLELPGLELEAELDWLARNNIFIRSLELMEWPDGTLSNSYVFTHALYQNVLYARVSCLHRVKFHRRLGCRLEAGFARCPEQISGKLAVHFEIGRQYPQAVCHLIKMAEVSCSRGANCEALLTLDKAIGLLGKISCNSTRDKLEIKLLLLQASSITASQGNATPAIEDCFQRALLLCKRAGDEHGKFRSMFGLRSFYVISGEYDKAYALALESLNFATASGDKALLIEAHIGMANSEFFVANHEACHAHVLEGISLYDAQSHYHHALLYGLDPGVFCHARAAQTAWLMGFPNQALNHVHQSLEFAEIRQHPYSLVLSILVSTQIYLYLGRTSSALESVQRGKELAKDHGFTFAFAWALHLSAWALAQNGDREAAQQELQCAASATRPVSLYADSYLQVFLAQANLALNLPEDGLRCLSSPTLGQSYTAERGWLRTEMTSMLVYDETSILDVIDLAQDTLSLCREQNARIYELKTALCLAELYRKTGDETSALQCLTPLLTDDSHTDELADISDAIELIARLQKFQPASVIA